MNKEETPPMVPLSGSSTSLSLGGESTTTSTAYGYPSGSAWNYTTETETFDHLADYNLIGGLTMP
jgi:hypothetical protein